MTIGGPMRLHVVLDSFPGPGSRVPGPTAVKAAADELVREGIVRDPERAKVLAKRMLVRAEAAAPNGRFVELERSDNHASVGVGSWEDHPTSPGLVVLELPVDRLAQLAIAHGRYGEPHRYWRTGDPEPPVSEGVPASELAVTVVEKWIASEQAICPGCGVAHVNPAGPCPPPPVDS